MNSRLLVAVTIALVVCSCRNVTTDTLLAANVSDFDKSPPEPLSPTSGSLARSLDVTFTWTSRAGFATYQVEVSTSSDFSKPIAGSPFTAQGNSLLVNLPDAVQYWWQVKTSLMQGSPVSATFNALDDAIYVYCQESTTCDDTGQLGNKLKPYQTLRVAISNAKAFGKKVKVASRGSSGAAYSESITMADGVSMYGGYNSTFVESQRNTATNITAVSSSAIPVTASLLSSATVFDGFKVQGLLGYGVYLDQCSSNIIIRNSTILSGDVTSGNTAAITINGGSPVITGVTATAGNATATGGGGGSYAVVVQSGSSSNISGSTLNGGVTSGSGSSQAIRILASSPTIINNTLVGGSPNNAGNAGESYTIGISASSSPIIKNNTITSGNPAGSGDTVGVVVTGSSSVLLVNNTIMAGIGATGKSSGIQLNVIAGSGTVIVNNIIGSIDTTNVYCVEEVVTGSNPSQLLNNLLFGCATALYQDADGPTAIPAIGTVNSTTSVGAGNTASGNVTITATQNPFVSQASKNYRLQNNGAPMTAQQWLDIAYGGLNTSASTYGSITTDFDSKTRTATTGGATNNGASGYSIGAFEY